MSVGSSTSTSYSGYIAYSVQEALVQSASGAENQTAASAKGDSVEISDAARVLLEAESKGEVKEIAKKSSISAERLEEMRTKMQNVLGKKKSLGSMLKSIMSVLRVDESTQKNLKIEVDRKGKVVVGGIDDIELARSIEKKLNEDKDFVREFKSYAKAEQDLSVELGKETGMSLKDFTRLNLARGIAAERRGEESEEGVEGLRNYTTNSDDPDDEISRMMLKGKSALQSDLLLADPGLADMALEIATFSGANFSSEKQGVADPESALTSMLNEARTKIQRKFTKYNKEVAPKGATSPEEEYARQLSLSNVEISIAADGSISIKGNFAESAGANAEAEKMVREILEEMIHEDEVFGMESVFTTAMRQMGANHKNEHGENKSGDARLSLKNGVADAYIHSDTAIAEAQSGIQTEAASYLQSKLGVQIGEEDLEISETGRITLSEAYQGEQAEKIRTALNEFNNRVADLLYKKPDSDSDRFEADDTGHVESVARLIREMAAYRHGGLSGRFGYGAQFVEE